MVCAGCHRAPRRGPTLPPDTLQMGRGPGGQGHDPRADPHRGAQKCELEWLARAVNEKTLCGSALGGWQMDRDELWSRAKSQNLFLSLWMMLECLSFLFSVCAHEMCDRMPGVSLCSGVIAGRVSTLVLFCRTRDTHWAPIQWKFLCVSVCVQINGLFKAPV